MGTQSDIRDQRYRTEPDIGTSDIGLKCAEADIMLDIGIKFCPISDIQHKFYDTPWRSGKTLDILNEGRGFETSTIKLLILKFYSGHM